MSKKPEDNQAAVDVTLILPHTHAGVDYDIGATIAVSELEKAWLIEQGRIADDKASAA